MKPRIHYLDGIRGWSAVSVLIFHIFYEMFGIAFPAFRSSEFNFFQHGPLAVCIFFTLSGDALTSPYLLTRDVDTIRKIAYRRYFRLTIPVLLSCLLCYALLKADLVFNLEAAKLLDREDWLSRFAAFSPSFKDAVQYSVHGVYFKHSAASSYNPFLWTMSIEMLGSLLILLFALQIDKLRNPASIALSIAVIFYAANSFYSLFFFGAYCSILRSRGFFNESNAIVLAVASWITIIAVIVSCAQSENVTTDPLKINMIRAMLIVFAVHGNRFLIVALESRLSKFLGQISFSLYLVHFAVLISLTSFCAVYIASLDQLSYQMAVCIGLMSVLASVVVAWIFYKIETVALKYTYAGLQRLEN